MRRAIVVALVSFVAATRGRAQRPTESLDTAGAVAALRDFESACTRDAAALWGQSLCGRIILVDLGSRTIVASQGDSQQRLRPWGSAYLGPWTDSIGAANTSVRWDGAEWATVRLPLPADRFTRLALMLHEAFHRIQVPLGLGSTDRANSHLDERDGRYWLRLELRALAAAITADDAAARTNARDALLFRAERHRLYPAADSAEPALEMQEGLAEYTGERLAQLAVGGPTNVIARQLEEWQATPSYTRSFAYATGPGLGFVLDRFDSAWRTKIAARRNLASLLGDAVGVSQGSTHATAVERARNYNALELAAAEDARETARQTRLRSFAARFVDGPLLIGRQPGLGRSFNPNNLAAFPGQGTVYPTGAFQAVWGRLTVDSVGVLVAPDFTWIRLSAPTDTAARPLRGVGWTLELAPGWTIKAGARAGDLEIVQGSGAPKTTEQLD